MKLAAAAALTVCSGIALVTYLLYSGSYLVFFAGSLTSLAAHFIALPRRMPAELRRPSVRTRLVMIAVSVGCGILLAWGGADETVVVTAGLGFMVLSAAFATARLYRRQMTTPAAHGAI